jgi:hypothetical protein
MKAGTFSVAKLRLRDKRVGQSKFDNEPFGGAAARSAFYN